MPKTLTALKARQNLGEILEEVYYRNGQYIIERAGKPMAAVVPVWQLRTREQHRERLIGMMNELWKKIPKVSPEIVEQEVAEAVRAVRAKAARKSK